MGTPIALMHLICRLIRAECPPLSLCNIYSARANIDCVQNFVQPFSYRLLCIATSIHYTRRFAKPQVHENDKVIDILKTEAVSAFFTLYLPHADSRSRISVAPISSPQRAKPRKEKYTQRG